MSMSSALDWILLDVRGMSDETAGSQLFHSIHRVLYRKKDELRS